MRPESNTIRGIGRRLTFAPWSDSQPTWGMHRRFKTETITFDDTTACFFRNFSGSPAFSTRWGGGGQGEGATTTAVREKIPNPTSDLPPSYHAPGFNIPFGHPSLR